MKTQLLLFAFLSCLAIRATGQEPYKVTQLKYGTLVLLPSPPMGKTIAKVGDTIFQNAHRIRLLAGTYEVTFWSPYFKPVTRSVILKGDSILFLKERLVLTEEMAPYQKARAAYNGKVIAHKVIPYAATGMLAAGSAAAWLRAWKYQKDAKHWDEKYKLSVSYADRTLTQGEYARARRTSIGSRKTLYVLSGLTLAGAYISWRGHKKMASIEKPMLPPQSPPFEVEGFGARLDDDRPVFSLTLKF